MWAAWLGNWLAGCHNAQKIATDPIQTFPRVPGLCKYQIKSFRFLRLGFEIGSKN